MARTIPAQPGLPGPVRRLLARPVFAALATPHGVDRYLEALNPLWAVNEVRAQVVAVEKKTAGSLTLTLRPNNNWQGFKAGQYVRLTVDVNGVRRTRCFSPANSVHAQDGLLELTMKVNSQGQLTQYLDENARIGMIVRLSQADGSFALPDSRPERILLISGGSGITPVMAMLRTLCEEGFSGPITFLHYALTERDVIYRDELSELAVQHPNVKLVRAYTEQATGGELNGFFCREHLINAAPDFADAQTFLCGPPGMMKVVQDVYAAAGLSERLHLEHFTSAAITPVSTDDTRGEIRFARSERSTVSNGRSLLEQAEGLGLAPASGCRIGICKSCTCRKTTGVVRDLRTGQLSEAGEQDIQICISAPVGAVTLDI